MFIKPKPKSKLDEVIEDALDYLKTCSVTDDDYDSTVAKVERLMEIKQQNKRDRVSMDTLAIVGGNILGILMIVGHEKAHVVTSKALSFVMKAR